MVFQKIICENRILEISKQEALKLEITINLLPDIEYWKEIGDKLFNYHSNNKVFNIQVNSKQFIFLKYLIYHLK